MKLFIITVLLQIVLGTKYVHRYVEPKDRQVMANFKASSIPVECDCTVCKKLPPGCDCDTCPVIPGTSTSAGKMTTTTAAGRTTTIPTTTGARRKTTTTGAAAAGGGPNKGAIAGAAAGSAAALLAVGAGARYLRKPPAPVDAAFEGDDAGSVAEQQREVVARQESGDFAG